MREFHRTKSILLKGLLRKYYEWESKCGDGMAIMYEGPQSLEHYEHLERMKLIRELCTPAANEVFLDIGCGEGHYVKQYAKSGCRTVGVDISMGKLKMARKRLARVNAELRMADAECLPFADEVFDWVLCSEVMEHLPEPDKALGEIKRILKRGGRAVVSVPTWSGVKADSEAAGGRGRKQGNDYDLDLLIESQFARPFQGHLWSFSVNDFEQIIERTGFEKIRRLIVPVFLSHAMSRLHGLKGKPKSLLTVRQGADTVPTPFMNIENSSRYAVWILKGKE